MRTLDMATTRTEPADAPGDVARALLRAVTTRDRAATASLLAPNVWMRALLPRALAETHTDSEALDVLDDWLGDAAHSRVLETAHHTVEGREHIRYRMAVLPEWEPTTWHVLEQSGYVRAIGGLITRIDLVCTGYWSVEAPSPD